MEEKREKEKDRVGSVAPEYQETASVFLDTSIAPTVPSRGLKGARATHILIERKEGNKEGEERKKGCPHLM